MAVATHGMDPEEVKRLGQQLQQAADRLRHSQGVIERLVHGVSWVGRDAEQFKHQWWPNHRTSLGKVIDDLHGFGQSALNNAEEQLRVSSVQGAGQTIGAGAIGAGAIGAGAVGAGAVAAGGGGGAGGPGQIGGSSGSLGGHRSRDEVRAAYEAGSPVAYRYQCTSWAMYRWREMGFDGDFGLNADGRTGHGFQMAANNGGTTSTPPTLGAMASYGSAGDYGHVMIVEEMRETPQGLQVRVSEMNIKGQDPADITGYSDQNWLTQNPDGTWTKYGRNVGPITFAGFPK